MPTKPRTHRPRGVQDRRDRDRAYDAKRLRDPVLSRARRIRNSARWQTFRAWFKRRHPVCCDPFGHHQAEGRVEATDHPHHIVGLAARPDLAYVETNCAPLCAACHNQVEQRVRAGDDTRHLFKR